MVSVEQANEIVAKLQELEKENHLMQDLFKCACARARQAMTGSGTTHARDVQRHGHRIR